MKGRQVRSAGEYVGWLIVLLIALLWVPSMAGASRPVERRLTGCVVKGEFFSVSLDREQKPVRAYRIRMKDGGDLRNYEGNAVVANGWLYPGDLFVMKRGSGPAVGGTCPESYRKVINREFLVDYVVAAHKAAEKGDFTNALGLAARALEIDPADCQTYVDRAYIYYLQGDFARGGQDVGKVKNGACADRSRLNFLVMEDVAKILARQGKKAEAMELYKMALESCRSDICRESVNKEIEKQSLVNSEK